MRDKSGQEKNIPGKGNRMFVKVLGKRQLVVKCFPRILATKSNIFSEKYSMHPGSWLDFSLPVLIELSTSPIIAHIVCVTVLEHSLLHSPLSTLLERTVLISALYLYLCALFQVASSLTDWHVDIQ